MKNLQKLFLFLSLSVLSACPVEASKKEIATNEQPCKLLWIFPQKILLMIPAYLEGREITELSLACKELQGLLYDISIFYRLGLHSEWNKPDSVNSNKIKNFLTLFPRRANILAFKEKEKEKRKFELVIDAMTVVINFFIDAGKSSTMEEVLGSYFDHQIYCQQASSRGQCVNPLVVIAFVKSKLHDTIDLNRYIEKFLLTRNPDGTKGMVNIEGAFFMEILLKDERTAKKISHENLKLAEVVAKKAHDFQAPGVRCNKAGQVILDRLLGVLSLIDHYLQKNSNSERSPTFS